MHNMLNRVRGSVRVGLPDYRYPARYPPAVGHNSTVAAVTSYRQAISRAAALYLRLQTCHSPERCVVRRAVFNAELGFTLSVARHRTGVCEPQIGLWTGM